ncbi:MAG: hypothetical protein RL456_2291 [Pseudomonadota bacterium]|jgi:hypothetical protein
MALSNAQGFIGAGDVYIAPINSDGSRGKMVDIGNTTKLAIKPNSDIKEQKSKKRDSYGQVLETAALQQPAELSVTLETVNREGLRYAFMGADTAYSQTSGTVTDEDAIAVLDGWVKLAAEDISAVVITNSGATTTYVLGTDYVLNTRMGMFKALSTGAITEAQALKVDYTKAAFTGAAIRGNVQPQIRAYMLLDGQNLVDNSIGIMEVYEVVLTPSSEFDWFKDDFNTIELTGKLKTPSGKTEPFVYKAR